MKKHKSSISKAKSYEEIGEFWNTHDLSEYWEQTKSAKLVGAGKITGAEVLTF